MSLHWVRVEIWMCDGCEAVFPSHGWATIKPNYPREVKPGEGPVMQDMGTYRHFYCNTCAKQAKDQESKGG